MEMFEVGGCVRDELLGVTSKDRDFTVVLSGNEDGWHTMGGNDPFRVMSRELTSRGFKIFLESPQFLTIRARFPKDHPVHPNVAADFVLARKEGTYADGRRPDSVEPGTLLDDLARRDFTVNAMAKDAAGNLIDPFGGQQDLADGILRAVGDADERIREDSLRILRALRFSITKDMMIDPALTHAMLMNADLLYNVSVERVREELEKMFRHNTWMSMQALQHEFYGIGEIVIEDMKIRLKPTLEK